MSDPLSENQPTEPPPSGGKAPSDGKPVRRTGVVATRRGSSSGGQSPRPSAPPPPDTAKTIAFAVCGLLLIGIIGTGVYLAFIKAPPPPKTVKLSPEAQELKDLATRAKTLYDEGKALSASDKLEDLQSANEKLTEANKLFSDVVARNQTLEGIKDEIKLAEEKTQNFQKELTPLRVKIENMEGEERRKKSLATKPDKAPDGTAPTPPQPTPGGKEPTADELSDANLDRLFKDDPSEYERLAKKRKEKDPAYVIKKEQ